MAYVPTVWENDITEVDEDNMNHIEQGIKDNDDKLQGLTSMGSIVVDSIRSKNVFDKNVPATRNYAGRIEVLETGIRIYTALTTNNQWACFKVPNSLLGKTITISSKITPSSTNQGAIRMFYGTDNNVATQSTEIELNTTGSITLTLLSSMPSGCDSIYLLLYANRTGTTAIDDYVDYTDLMIEEGTTATSYSPYQELNIDYKKGTWTPVMQNATVNYTIQSGEYIKIGNLVYISFRLRGKITSIPQYPYAFITGIPFKPSNVPGCGSFYEYADCFNDNTTPRLMRISFDGTYPNGFVAIQNGGVGGMGISWWVSSNNTFYLSGSGFYIVN